MPDYPEWQRPLDLLGRIASEGFDRLSADEIIEFGKWYRRAAVELAYQRTRGADPERIAFLNDLVGRCYAYVYVAPHRPLPSVLRFFTAEFPRAFRRHGLWMLISALVFFLPAVLGFVITWHDRALAAQVLSPQLVEAIDTIVERHNQPKDWLTAKERPQAASEIMTNNIGVTILVFAGGMTGGIITVVSLVFNGLMLGIIGAGVAQSGAGPTLNFWAFVAPHGVIELSAIYIAGGAGLLLGYALINPGVYPRRVALMRAGREAFILIMGVAALLVVAGLVEGFFSPAMIDEEFKYTVAVVLFGLLYSYLFLAGRGAADPADHPALARLMVPLPPM